jgi:hypothetical protein
VGGSVNDDDDELILAEFTEADIVMLRHALQAGVDRTDYSDFYEDDDDDE